MYKIGEYVVYKKDVCKIEDIKNVRNQDYYVLIPMSDKSLKINVPVDNKFGLLRNLITKEELEKIIEIIPNISIVECNDKMIENEYRTLMNSGKHEDLISIIKTTYLRNKERLDNNKKIGDKDNSYFELAEKYLYNEFSIVLNMSYEDTKKYVIDKVSKLEG